MSVDAADEAVAEEGSVEACHPQIMLDLPSCLLQVERGKLVADGDPLLEGGQPPVCRLDPRLVDGALGFGPVVRPAS